MKKLMILLFGCLLGAAVNAQDLINFNTSSGIQSYTLYDDDSIYFDAGHTTLFFSNNSNVLQFTVADILDINFSNDISNNVYIAYNGSTVNVVNPLAGNGVDVTVNGAMVTVISTTLDKDVNYICSGTSTNGMFKIYSEYKYNLILDNLNLTNPTGPAINSQSEKRARIHLLAGTTNSITDGLNYTANATEDQKGTLFAEGKIDLIGSGSLTVNGLGTDQHAIATDEDLEILEGSVVVASAVKDGVHTSEGFFMNGGEITIVSTSDGIDGGEGNIEINCGEIAITSTSADVKAIKCDSTFVMTGGTITMTISGAQSKGIKCGQDMQLLGGSITAANSGAAVLVATGSGTEPSYGAIISCDTLITIDGATLNLTNSGVGTRAITTDGNLVINSGSITTIGSGNGTTYTNSTGTLDAYHGTGIRANGSLTINGGTITVSHSGKGGKGIDTDGALTIGNGSNTPELTITTTGTATTITSGGGGGPGGSTGTSDKPKAMKANGAVVINSGNVAISSTDDGIKSTTSVTVNNASLNISTSVEGIEAPFITINNGDVSVSASNDALNATQGTVSGGTESNDGSLLKIAGGRVVVSATSGDAIDSNGSVQITGGVVIAHGPNSAPELGLDLNGTATVTGGLVVISGPSQQMLESFSTSSSQRSFTLKTSPSVAANTLFHIEDASGNSLVSFKPSRAYQTIIFSSPAITNGTQYKVYTSGTDSGTLDDGLYSGGTYTAGTLETTFTVSGMVSTVTF